MLNVVAIMGRLVADPELRTTTSGINMARFRIACDRNFARQGEQRQADFLDVVLASKTYFGRRYPFTRCLLAGTFYPLIDRVKYGGLGPFLKEMGRLPPAAKLALPFYFAGRCLGLVWNKFFEKKEARAWAKWC